MLYEIQLSEYPYEGRINSDDIINCKDVFSSDGAIIGQVEAVHYLNPLL